MVEQTDMIAKRLEVLLNIGQTYELGRHTFTKEEIIAFGTKYDPQPFHIDEDAAKQSFFGGLCASGWQTAAIWMKLQRSFAQENLTRTDFLQTDQPETVEFGPSPGFTNLRWRIPVFAGTTLTYYGSMETLRASNSLPGWFLAQGTQTAFNQDEQLAFEFQSSVFVRLAPKT